MSGLRLCDKKKGDRKSPQLRRQTLLPSCRAHLSEETATGDNESTKRSLRCVYTCRLKSPAYGQVVRAPQRYYRAEGITWWDYCGEQLVNSYPTYIRKLPALVERIRGEMRTSKNYVLFLGETGAETNQQPCLSLVQFQIERGALIVSAYQRSSDASLGLPSDIYHLYLMAREVGLPLKSITLFLANVYIYESNLLSTFRLLQGDKDVKFTLNV